LWYGDKGQFPTSPLRLKIMQATETGTISNQRIVLPSTVNGDGVTVYSYLETQRLSVSSGGDTWALRYLPPQQYAEKEAGSSDPNFYTFRNGAIYTAQSNALAYTHDYYQKRGHLSDTLTTSPIMTAYPELYLFAACIEGALDIMSDSMAARFAARLQARIGAINSIETASFAGGSLAVTIGR
jgi:hypothetical protein